MSKSQIACAFESRECAVVRLKTSGNSGYTLCACKSLPLGLDDLAAGKGKRILKKLGGYLREWPQEEIALCVKPETYLPLPTSFPANATPEECREFCRIEASYFLSQPDKYHCDFTGYGNGNGLHERQLLLFYPATPCKTAYGHFAANHRVGFTGTPQLPLIHLSSLTDEPQVILELEENYVLLTVSRKGRMEKFAFRQVKSREETEYFTIRKLLDNPLYRDTGVQVTGSKADKAMIALIGRETSLTMKPLGLPRSIPISNPDKFSLSSSAAIKAVSTALMGLAEE